MTAKALDGARDQRERLVNTAGECVGGAERGAEERDPDDNLPLSAEVEAPLEERGRAWEVPATEVGTAKIEQSPVQRERMIGRFSDPHGGLGVSDCFVEPTELGEHVGQAGARDRRLDAESPKRS